MTVLQREYNSVLSSRVIVVTCTLIMHAAFAPMTSAAPFNYNPINEPILSAKFSVDFAALTAHRTVGGFEVNTAMLLGLGGTELDLSDIIFGTADALSDSAMIDQDPLGTGLISAPIDSSFFSELAKGSVGLWAIFTDTFDGLFAIDFISIEIETASSTTEALMDNNNGFGIGLSDGDTLPSPLPISISINATGTGFDESISSKSIHVEPITEPATMLLLGSGIIGLAGLRKKFKK
jgi:hypothetical protein